ncbi:hypothetical protein DRN67_03600, partial [Candidatus Micrarchaeota archaeon]
MAADFITNLAMWYEANSHIVFGVLLVLLGPFFAQMVGGFVKYGLKKAKVERWLREHGLHDSVAGISPLSVVVTLVKLAVFLLFLKWGADIAMIPGVSADAGNFVAFMTNVIWAVIILSTGLIIADYIGDRMKKARGVLFSGVVALAAEGLIIYLALVEAFNALGRRALVTLMTNLFNAMVYGIALAIGLAFGLAFGLGLKDQIATVARDKSSDIGMFLK